MEKSGKIIQVIWKWRRNRFNTFQLLTNTKFPLLIKYKNWLNGFQKKHFPFYYFNEQYPHFIWKKTRNSNCENSRFFIGKCSVLIWLRISYGKNFKNISFEMVFQKGRPLKSRNWHILTVMVVIFCFCISARMDTIFLKFQRKDEHCSEV